VGRTACTQSQCLYKGALYLYLYPDVRNFANNLGEVVANSTMSIRNFNIEGNQFIKEGKMGFSRFLIYRYLSPLSPHLFYSPSFNTLAKRKLFLGRKNIGGGVGDICPHLLQVAPMSILL